MPRCPAARRPFAPRAGARTPALPEGHRDGVAGGARAAPARTGCDTAAMAETSLRAYIREIDDFIEHDQLDEAIAHARHILQTYPRHLDTYRLLGKAYLEAKRYGDSADILQRVLSAVPDDFVAHIGMSIVREDEGNLESAIWHMERAFETNPSNAAVQGELRRLIGRRDGLEPHKVRLTRGALARMYAHGELYPQSIAELRAALTEDSERPDLQVLLAEMYWRTNQRAEAAEVASAILGSLPNCREANRILAAALQAQGRTEEALSYLRRVAALDPYSALVETIQDDAASVDANAVRIEKLVWQPGQPVGRDTGPASWATGAAGEGRASGTARPAQPRPSWLDSLGAETAARAAAAAAAQRIEEPAPPPVSAAVPTENTPPAEAEPAGPIPEWMQAAGWTPGSGEAAEGPVSFSDDELRSLEAGMLPPDAAPEPEGGLARAEIPDWLKDVAPPEADAQAPELPQEAAEAAASQGISGLGEPRLPPGWSAASEGPDSADDDWLKDPADEAPAVPTWMEEEAPGATATIVTWLGDRSRQEPPTAEQSAPQPPAASASADNEVAPEPADLPEWLADQVPSTEEAGGITAGEAASGPPAWLSGVAEAAAMGSTLGADEIPWEQEAPEEPIRTGMYPEGEAPAQPGAMPEWLQTIAGGESASRAGPGGEATPEWLQPEPARAPAPPAAPSEGGTESFGWLRELAESEPPTPSSSQPEAPPPSWMAEPASGSRATLGRSAGPEWLRGIAEPEPSGSPDTTSMDWLRGISEGPAEEAKPAAEPARTPAAEPRPTDSGEWVNLVNTANPSADSGTTGEWLRMLKEEEGVPAPEHRAGPATAAAAAVPAAAPASEMDDAQVFDWLEALAAKQGIPAPEAVSETPPGASPIAQAPPVAAVPSKAIPEEPDAGLKWLEELAAEQSPAPGAEPADRVAPPLPTPTTPAPAPVAPLPQATPPMAAAKPPVPPRLAEAAAEAAQPSPEVPDWLKQLVAETPPAAVEPAAAVSPAAETLPSLPEWMVTPLPAEDEPTVPPLPPIAAPSLRAEPEQAEPIDELAESWVPPWEQLAEEPSTATTAGPTDETVIHRRATVAAEPQQAEPIEMEAEEIAAPAPEPVSVPVRYKEPSTDILAEVPDWLRTPAPRQPAAAVEIPAEAEKAPEPGPSEDEVPDWLVASEPAASVPGPVAPEVVPVPVPAAAVEPLAAAEAPPPVPQETVPKPEPVVRAAPPAPLPVPAVPAAHEPVAAARRPEPVPPSLPPAVPSSKPPLRAPKPKMTPGLEDKLVEARHSLAVGDYRRAATEYAVVIKRKYQLDEVTSELEVALSRNPKAAPLWQALGDAYMKGDRLPDAISAYERGMAAA